MVSSSAEAPDPSRPAPAETPASEEASDPATPAANGPPTPAEAKEASSEGRPERKRRRGWDAEEPKSVAAASSMAAKMSAARMEAMVKSWVPTEAQLDAMSVEELQRVLAAWKADSKFNSKDALLAKAKKIILGH
mmetsp:Transcript_80928/g.182591  ORF Transcript_80928/g.182591 Transcript_80928/m.182591 type:complete len:135 (+) Transcript_80928:65-469(+)